MKKDKLDCIEYVDSQLIEKAETYTAPKKNHSWVKWVSAAAACLVLVAGVGSIIMPRMGNSNPGKGGETGGHDESTEFMSYAGPMFPMTLAEENVSITARRDLTMDFTPWIPVEVSGEERYSENILVTDSYTLNNTDAKEQTVSVLYPFVSSMSDLHRDLPTLSVDGKEVEAVIHAGISSTDAYGSWENYSDLLSDGSHLQKTLDDAVDLSNISVTVYEFTDPWGPEENYQEGIYNPTIRVMFGLDFEKTKVLSYGFNQGLNDVDKGIMGRGFSIPMPQTLLYGKPCYLIVLGDDITNMSCEGFVTGGWDTEESVEAGVNVTRTISNLEDALRLAATCHYEVGFDDGLDEEPAYDFEMYFEVLKEELAANKYIELGNQAHYDSGMLEEIQVVAADRVFWLEAQVTIPAGENSLIAAEFEKKPSHDFYCADTKNRGIDGYDMVTELGSNLHFDKQTVKLEDRGQLEIVRQNFGFDLENGIIEVELTEPHYYLEVRRVKK